MWGAMLVLQNLFDEALCPDIDTTKVFGFPMEINVIDFHLNIDSFSKKSDCGGRSVAAPRNKNGLSDAYALSIRIQ